MQMLLFIALYVKNTIKFFSILSEFSKAVSIEQKYFKLQIVLSYFIISMNLTERCIQQQ